MISIKPLNIKTDLNALTRLHLSINGEDNDAHIESFYQNYNGDVYMFHYENNIIGFSALSNCLWDKVSIIEEMAIDSNYQNQGFGKILLNFIIEKSKTRGDRFITVQTATWNKRAIKFYEREGFTSQTVLSKYYGDKYDLVWLDMKIKL
jgi:ribosomal protein S18 acetylase RimI-like enzyme